MSKWSALPDIDESGSEVFETADVPNTFSQDDDSDLSESEPCVINGNEDILQGRLNVGSARDKFKGSRLHSADFSLKQKKKKKKTQVYEILPREYSTDAANVLEREDAAAKIKRLRFELEELELDLEAGQENKQPDSGIPAAAALLGQLRTLKTDLTKLSDRPTSQPTLASPSPLSREVAPKRLPPPSVTELASQLTILENLIGPSSLASIDTLSSSTDNGLPSSIPLTVAITKLESQLQLLTQPRHFDTLSRRIKVIVTDLERIHETRRKLGDTSPLNVALSSGLTVSAPGDGSSPAKAGEDAFSNLPANVVPRLQALLSLIPRLNALAPLTPSLLLRLRSLATLHSSAATFESRLAETTKQVSTLTDSAQAMQSVLSGVQASLEANEGVIKSNLGALEDRVGKLAERIADLQSR